MNEFIIGAAVCILLLAVQILLILYKRNLEKWKHHEQLVQKYGLLVNIMHTVDVGTWSYDYSSRRVPFTSEALNKITGYRPEYFATQEAWETIIHPDDFHLYRASCANVRQGISDFSEYRIVHACGDTRWVQVRMIPTLDETNGRILRLDGVVLDIMARKAAEEALQRSEQRYRSLFEHHSDVIVELDLHGKVLDINSAALEITGSPHNIANPLSLIELFGVDSLKRMSVYFDQVVQGTTQTFEMTSFHKEGRMYHWDMKMVPVYVNGAVKGVFVLCRDITSKKRTERSLHNSEATYRLIAENMTDLVAVVGRDGKFRYASPSYKARLGLDESTAAGLSLYDMMHPEDGKLIRHKLEGIPESACVWTARCRLIHANGSELHFDCVANPVREADGNVESIIIVSRNITEKVLIERELMESEERYRHLIELLPQPLTMIRDERFIYANPAGLELFGAALPCDLIGRSIYEFMHPDYVEQARGRALAMAREKYAPPLEYRMVRTDGSVIDVEVTGIYDGLTHSSLHVHTDITVRKQMEQALRDSEERYRSLVELSPVSIALYKDGRVIYANPAAVQVLGAGNAEEIIGTTPQDWIQPDSLLEGEQAIRDSGASVSIDLAITRRDGNVIDMLATAIYDERSEAFLVFFEDITTRKQAETALQESERLSRHLVELSPIPTVLTRDHKFEYVNPAGLDLFGAGTTCSLIGRSIYDTVHPNCRDKVRNRLNAVYENKEATRIAEHKIVRLDGRIIDAEAVSIPIPYIGRDAAMTVIRDISDQKKAEKDRNYAEQIVRESKDRYYMLQTSLDRFSSDLFGLMNVQELDRRLIQEIREMICTEKVSLVEVDKQNKITVKNGSSDIPQHVWEEIVEGCSDPLPVCEIIDTPDGHLIRIGEIKGKSYLLCIGEKSPSLVLQSKRVWIKTIARYASVLYDNFRVIEDLTQELRELATRQKTPSWLTRLLFTLSENESKRLSQDLHDGALQEQIIWYRKLDELSADAEVPPGLREKLAQITQGLLDVIYQIRITCNELRPPMLKEEGLVTSLEALFEFTQLRSDYSIVFDYTGFHGSPLDDDLLIGLYRIVQELLANATKHSNAAKVQFKLSAHSDRIHLSYEDNGIGMNVSGMVESFNSMGVYGIKERVRSMDGDVEFYSSPNSGLAVFINVPVKQNQKFEIRNWSVGDNHD
ncbi:PAS domain S-box protein [Paenibacillus chitinolyticus]|uniref:PAS domain-containing sensor histidine kinase n=1 Tax=Paenibacillus chitinolyticus TaxID=79263 RepID=UPI002DBEC644|nr:PAS domain S-box protein [Paenibacillus chitinolyticus]MEC0247959.1 PAS domain S-box protein [Paenibacillus chitinolyticus]